MLLAREGQARAALDRLIVPVTVVAFAITILPLLHAETSSFYVGEKQLSDSAKSVLWIAWERHEVRPLSFTWMLPALLQWAPIAIPAVLVLAAAACCFKGASPLLILSAGSLIGSIFLLILGHRIFRILYPQRRTGLYWIPLFLLTCLLLIRMLLEKNRFAAAPFVGLAVICLAQFASQLSVRHYAEWAGDASTKRIVREIRRNHAFHPKADTKVGTLTWELEPGLNFYRRLYRLGWMQPVERSLPNGCCDYYVALPAEAGLLEKLSVTRIYEDPFTHGILAVPKSATD